MKTGSLFLAALVLAIIYSNAEAKVAVLVSIKPLALITQPLLGPDDQLSVLLPSVSSPHDYALKASDMSNLQRADLIIWMGPQMERFLSKPLKVVDKEVLTIDEGIAKQEVKRNGLSEDDPHRWLDPAAVKHMTQLIGAKLIELDPRREQDIRARIEEQMARLDELRQTLQRRFAPVREQAFVVYHRAYDHSVNAFGLNQVAAVTITPEQPPGARHLLELQTLIQSVEARCLFVEATHDSAGVRTIARQLGLQVALLDPLGVEQSVNSYPDLMLQLAEDMTNCLSANQ